MLVVYCYLLINVLILITYCDINYNGYSIISVIPRNQLDIKFINNLTYHQQIEYWFSSASVNQSVKLLLKRNNQQVVLTSLIRRKLIPKIEINDLGRLIVENQNPVKNQTIRDDNLNFFTSYQRFAVIEKYLENLTIKFPERVVISTFGQSFENRNLTLIRICSGSDSCNASKEGLRLKPIIYIQGGIHSREWISVTTVIYLANMFVNLAKSDETIKKLINYFEFWFVPIVNPDGYEYTHNKNRFWRKTRSINHENEPCVGVDPNRNFDYHWGVKGIENDPCSDIYPGPKPNSEPEVAAIVNLINRNSPRIKAFLDFHSFDQSWLIPYGFSSRKPKDFFDMERIAKKSTNALASIHGTKYSVGNKAELLYSASGLADDWAKGVAKIKYSFCIELSDKGEFGFLLPPSRIIPVGEEITEAIKVFSLELMKELNRSKLRSRRNKKKPKLTNNLSKSS